MGKGKGNRQGKKSLDPGVDEWQLLSGLVKSNFVELEILEIGTTSYAGARV